MPHQIYLGFIRLPLLLRTFLIAISSIIFFGISIHYLETEHFPTIFDGIWWAVITAATVGYGDYVPHSIIGRVSGILLIITSAGFLSSFFITLATTAATKQNDYLKGKAKFKGKDHYIIIGWNERSRTIINSLISEKRVVSIALIDETLPKNPLLHRDVHFVQGSSNLDNVLIQANIEKAKKVIITADANKGESQADMYTILTLLTVKGLNPQVESIVEILTNEQVANAKRAGADEIIQTNILTSFVMLQSTSAQDMVTSFLDLLYQLTEKKLVFQEAMIEEIEMDYTILAIHLLNEGKALLGIQRGEATILNPPQPFLIEKHDQLIIIT
ncbi:potassium channel protein [Bacillus sp. V3B]|uniref:potassium channel family protein n=1 Tax=Bacillus sp. V3B TaxID=2804915 RepID=UPI0021091889|nr:potassium channel family protein [Bacillus sp. V3B]MCQ6276504.1 potassium channel protein [Bacillus sp. V3B]